MDAFVTLFLSRAWNVTSAKRFARANYLTYFTVVRLLFTNQLYRLRLFRFRQAPPDFQFLFLTRPSSPSTTVSYSSVDGPLLLSAGPFLSNVNTSRPSSDAQANPVHRTPNHKTTCFHHRNSFQCRCQVQRNSLRCHLESFARFVESNLVGRACS